VRPSVPAGRGSPPWAGSGPSPSSGCAAPLQPGGERLAGDAVVGVDVELARAGDDVVRQLRSRRRLVPARAGRPVAHILLVEGWLPMPGLIAVGRPEARGVGCEHFVADHDRAVGAAAELELGVGQDDAPLTHVVGGRRVDDKRETTKLLKQLTITKDLDSTIEVDVLIVTDVSLRQKDEDRLKQLLRLFETYR